jgi:beta-barrel assembly-enhancing protease
MDVPYFNATCSPNGMVVVYTGMLMRVENEAQLAFVLGHEITHDLNRHGLKGHRTGRDLSNALAFLSLGLAGASIGLGVPLGGAGSLAQLIAVGAFFSYSRENETEADAGGFEMAVAHGYDPRQGAAIWRNIDREQAANPRRKTGSMFYSSHPTNTARIAAMNKRADEMASVSHSENLGTGNYRDAVLAHRFQWLQEEVDRAQYAESIYVIGQLLKQDAVSGELNYFLGEAYRRRNAKGDGEKAMAAYRAAIAAPDVPVLAYRGLGLVALKGGKAEADTAREAFEKYLALASDAKDRATIEYYLTTMGAKK